MEARAKRSQCERRVLASASKEFSRCTRRLSTTSISSSAAASDEQSFTTSVDCAVKPHASVSATRAVTATMLRLLLPARNKFCASLWLNLADRDRRPHCRNKARGQRKLRRQSHRGPGGD